VRKTNGSNISETSRYITVRQGDILIARQQKSQS
jgi:hypothetical protein